MKEEGIDELPNNEGERPLDDDDVGLDPERVREESDHAVMDKHRMRPAKSSTQPRNAKTWCALKFKWAPVLTF